MFLCSCSCSTIYIYRDIYIYIYIYIFHSSYLDGLCLFFLCIYLKATQRSKKKDMSRAQKHVCIANNDNLKKRSMKRYSIYF